MKKMLIVTAVFTSISFAAVAQTKTLQVAKISLPTIQCKMSKAQIETYLKRIDGVNSVNVAVKKKEVTVKFLTDRTNIEMIKASIANVGYDVGDVAANPEAYKMLPKCCRKPE